MASIIRCECGFIARADSDDAVIAQIREHMRRDHPAVNDAVEPDELRGWIEIV
jgi:predicted small metal-binding protein